MKISPLAPKNPVTLPPLGGVRVADQVVHGAVDRRLGGGPVGAVDQLVADGVGQVAVVLRGDDQAGRARLLGEDHHR